MTAIAAIALVAAGSFTTIAGLITDPLVTTHGLSRTSIGIGVAVNMVLYGAVAPFSAALMDRYGLRRLTSAALALLAVAAVGLTTLTPTVTMFTLWWGLCVGVGAGSVTMVFGAVVAHRWFVRNVGVASGVLTAASVVGQFAMLPLLSASMGHDDWRRPVLICGLFAAAATVLVAIALRDYPSDLRVPLYGEEDVRAPLAPVATRPLTRTVGVLTTCLKSIRFWSLALMFLLCGATTNGLMWSHFTPAAADHGMAATVASSLLALIGFANIAGTLTAGWLSDRVDARVILATFFLARGLTLAVLPTVFGSTIDPGLVAFAVAFGVLDVATVPPTLSLCRRYFGDDAAMVFGWVNVFHQLGAGAMALLGGVIRDIEGDYTVVWVVGALLCVAAASLGVVAGRPIRAPMN